MNNIQTVVLPLNPSKSLMYMKDKMNINTISSQFMPHQDCAAGWFDRFKTINGHNIINFVTVGFIFQKISSPDQGPTRIYVEQNNLDNISEHTKTDKTIDMAKYTKITNQRINIMGDMGDVIIFDSHVVHDSGKCLTNERKMLFVTCAIIDTHENCTQSMNLHNEFIKTRNKSLTLNEIEQLQNQGKTNNDFTIDTFGKITLK